MIEEIESKGKTNSEVDSKIQKLMPELDELIKRIDLGSYKLLEQEDQEENSPVAKAIKENIFEVQISKSYGGFRIRVNGDNRYGAKSDLSINYREDQPSYNISEGKDPIDDQPGFYNKNKSLQIGNAEKILNNKESLTALINILLALKAADYIKQKIEDGKEAKIEELQKAEDGETVSLLDKLN